MKATLILLGIAVIAGAIIVFSHKHVDVGVASTPVAKVSVAAVSQAVIPSAIPAEAGTFTETGTIVIDTSHGIPGTPYILYSTSDASGKPSVRTKRLVFDGASGCQANGLPCATEQNGFPVRADEEVRISGTVRDDTVYVQSVEVLSTAQS